MTDWPFARPPFSVQTEALDRSRGRTNYMFFMEQGLGKTAVAYAHYLRARAAGQVNMLAVLCPNGLKSNWEDEAALIGADVHVTKWPWKAPPQDVLVMNYEALTLGNVSKGGIIPGAGGTALLELAPNRRIMLFCDESHRIKNPASNVGRFMLGHLMKEVSMRSGGTGTPYGNSPMDLYPQLRLGGALNGVNPFVFRNQFAQTGGYMGKQIVGIKAEKADELRDLIATAGFRALKKDWTDIPEKLYRPIRVDLPPSLTKRYREMQQDFVLMLEDTAVTADMVLSQMIKLQQISSGFVIDNEGKVHQLVEITKLPKFQALMDVIDANGSSKTIIFAFYRHTVDQLINAIEDKTGVMPAYIHGGMEDDEIRHQKAIFNDDAGPGQMVAQITAAKEGHTLLGGETRRCYTEVFYETTYSYITRSQCEDRAHRFGQRDNLLICDLISSPIEAKAIDALNRHQDVATTLLDFARDA